MSIVIDSKEKMFVHELKDLYSAEQQLLEALPKVIDSVNNPEAKQTFSSHLDDTKMQAERIEKIMRDMDFEPGGMKCVGMEGLIEEGKGLMEQTEIPADLLADALITGAQKIEKYEITAYQSAIKAARDLGNQEAAVLLQQSLDEEEEALDILEELA